MCGLFGCLTPHGTPPTAQILATTAVTILGVNAESRGTHSAGLAGIQTHTKPGPKPHPTTASTHAPTTKIGGTLIIKGLGKFSELPLKPHLDHLDSCELLIGHTRSASQGAINDLANVSPMLTTNLIGTHNGDIDTKTLPKNITAPRFGNTDSEELFIALDKNRTDRRNITRTLRTIHGRAALIWADRTTPDRLYIARTALSPLAIGWDQHGTMYWASNPNWFNIVNQSLPHRVEITKIFMIPEGVLYTIDTTTATIIDTRRFTPTCRERDIALTNTASHKGFSHKDKELDRTTFCHKIAPTPQTSNWVKGATWPKAATATHRVPFKPPNLRSESEPLDDHWLDGDFEPMMEDAYGSAGIDIEKFEQFCNANPDIGDSLYTYVTDELLDGDPVKALKIVEDAYRKEQKGQLATI